MLPSRNGFEALGLALAPRAGRNGRRVALVEEGGGMRGAFGAGVQAGFAEAGLPFDAFDALYGCSAGALNLTYWVSRMPGIGTRVYLEDLLRADPKPFFLHRSSWDLLARLARGLPALAIAAVGHAMSVTRPIDGAAVRSHHAPILIPLTRSDDLGTSMVDVRSLAPEDLMPTLLAGATIPVIAEPADHLGEEVFDGAFVSPLPVQQALADGFTDLVVILSLPRWKNPPAYEEWILRALAGRRKVSSRVVRSVAIGRGARKAALATLRKPPPGINVTVVAPDVLLGMALEQRPRWVRRFVDAGRASGRAAVELARLPATP